MAREILDSRGNPNVEVEAWLDDGVMVNMWKGFVAKYPITSIEDGFRHGYPDGEIPLSCRENFDADCRRLVFLAPCNISAKYLYSIAVNNI